MPGRSFYFNPAATGTGVFLGPTETVIMELIWDKKELSVKKALLYLNENHHLAYTTVMTVMNRLEQKKLLKKTKTGRSFVYQPVISKDNFISDKLKTVKNCLKNNFTN